MAITDLDATSLRVCRHYRMSSCRLRKISSATGTHTGQSYLLPPSKMPDAGVDHLYRATLDIDEATATWVRGLDAHLADEIARVGDEDTFAYRPFLKEGGTHGRIEVRCSRDTMRVWKVVDGRRVPAPHSELRGATVVPSVRLAYVVQHYYGGGQSSLVVSCHSLVISDALPQAKSPPRRKRPHDGSIGDGAKAQFAKIK